MGAIQKRKQAAVAALADDIENLDPAGIEYVGHCLIQVIEGVSLIHRGLNRDGKPVGYTVDTFSADRTLVGEYSTESGYFEPPFTKICNDCQHTKRQAPQVQQLYLISNQACRNTDWSEVRDAAFNALGGGVKFEIYDRDRLASDIYDQVIIKNNLVEYFADFLPSLWKAWTENAISHAVPDLPPDYVDDEERTRALNEALRTNQIVAINGISGSGKSYSATAYAQINQAAFRNVIWVSGKDIEGLQSLQAVTVARLGVSINLSSHLCTAACLLLVDDWKGDAATLKGLLPSKLHEETQVLVTCISKPSSDVFSIELPPLSRESADKLLRVESGICPSEEQANEICKRVGFHPLTLAIIRDTIRELGIQWQTIINDLSNIPNYEGPNQETIIQRILLNHSAGIANDLRALRWLNAPSFDAELALSLLGPSGVSKLIRRSLLKKSAGGMCHIHDLVFACLRHFNAGEISESEVEARFKGFLIGSWETGSYHFHRTLQIHSDKIECWVDLANPTPSAESYFFQLSERISKPIPFLEKLRKSPLASFDNNREARLSVIESIEQRYWNESDEGEKKLILSEGIDNFNEAISKTAQPLTKSDLFHHRGKLRFWNGDRDAAISDFEEVLGSDSKAFHAHLQLARIKESKREAGCAVHVATILDAFADDQEDVAITIVLGAFSELSKKPYQQIRDQYLGAQRDLLGEAIKLAAAEGFSQPYRALGQIGRLVSYHYPQRVIEMAEIVTFPPAADAKQSECFDIAELIKNIGKAHSEAGSQTSVCETWFEQALAYYERTPSPTEYHLTMKADCLIRLELFQDALDVLNGCRSAGNSAHWWHRRALALFGLDKNDDALASICEALSTNTDDRYLSAFLQIKARIEGRLGNPNAVDTLSRAVTECSNDKFRAALQAELESLRVTFP
jgi:tetratricopeptide (TPR) repeat protein